MKKMKFLVAALSLILIFVSCSKEYESHTDDYLVTKKQAIEIARKNVQNTRLKDINMARGNDNFKPLSILILNDKTKTTALYIVNYQNDGVIMP